MEIYRKFFHQYFLLYRPFINDLNRILNEYGLHYSQWSIMYYLDLYGSATLIEFSKHLYVEKPTITRTVSALEKLNYIEQIAGNDKREKRMRLTEKGMEVSSEIRHILDKYEKEIMEGVSEHEQADVIRIMGMVRDNIIKLGG